MSVKEPQDRKSKATDEAEGAFTFEHEGVAFTSSQSIAETLTPGWLRQNRRREELDFYFTLIEALFAGNKAALGVLDGMDWPDYKAVTKRLEAHMQQSMGAALGE